MLSKFSADIMISHKIGFNLSCKLSPGEETVCMKGQNLFSGKNKKNYQFVVCWIVTVKVKPAKFYNKWDHKNIPVIIQYDIWHSKVQ